MRFGDVVARARTLYFVLCTVLIFVPALLLGAPAAGHAFLVRSDPPAHAILAEAPATVSLWFTERLEPAATAARLVDQHGNEVTGTSYAIGAPDQLIVTLPAGLPNGTYSIVWRNISRDDGHPATGYVPFTIGTIADVVEVEAPAGGAETTGAPQWLRATARWLAFLGLFGALAIWPVWSLALVPALPRIPGALRAGLPVAGAFAIGALVLSVAGNLIALLTQAADAGGSYGSALRTTLLDTRFGTLLIWRMLLLTLHAFVLSFVRWHRPWSRPEAGGIALVTSLALVVPFSLNAHAAAQTAGRSFAIAADLVHLASAGIWAGGVALLMALLVVFRRRLPADRVRAAAALLVPRFSVLAIAAWLCLAATGLYAAWLQIGGFDAARETSYGRAFLVKMALAVLVLALAAFHLIVVTRRIARATEAGRTWIGRLRVSLGVELGVLALLLLAAGWLTSLPPARESVAAALPDTRIVETLDASDIEGTLLIAPGIAGPNTITLQLPAGTAPGDVEALLRLTGPDPSMGTDEIRLDATGDGIWSVTGSHFSVNGDWSLTAIVRKVGEFQWQATTTAFIVPAATDVESSDDRPWHLGNRAIAGLALLVLVAPLVGIGVVRALRTEG